MRPATYRMILDGERRSCGLFDGHSSAMAQVYNHLIMPLASRRDRLTQIRWGIADYKHRFGHAPEGMWLAETAADTESLELLAQEGIRFTVLAPRQCKRVRPLNGGKPEPMGQSASDLSFGDWINTPNATVDPTHPYLARFNSGSSLAIFFYDGPTSRAIAFEGLLNSGEAS
jgi:alpha-amylase/alpha-mannosidase (GH57 family)